MESPDVNLNTSENSGQDGASSPKKRCLEKQTSVNLQNSELQTKYNTTKRKIEQQERTLNTFATFMKKIGQLECNLLTCSICDDTYPSLTSLRLLPCAHIFCTQCLSKWTTLAQQGSTENFECPLCRTRHNVPKVTIEKEWPHPHFLDDFLKCMQVNTCSTCQQLEKREIATWMCSECNKSYCDLCRVVHDSTESGHEVMSIGPHEKAAVTGQNFCKVHECKEVEVFCTDCTEMSCALCLVDKHKGHNCSDITDAVTAYKQFLSTDKLNIRTAESEVSEFLQHLTDASDTASEAITQSLLEVNKRAEDIMAEVRSYRDNERSKLISELKLFNQKVSNLKFKGEARRLKLSKYEEDMSNFSNESVGNFIKLRSEYGPHLLSPSWLKGNVTLEVHRQLNNKEIKIDDIFGKTQAQIVSSEPNEIHSFNSNLATSQSAASSVQHLENQSETENLLITRLESRQFVEETVGLKIQKKKPWKYPGALLYITCSNQGKIITSFEKDSRKYIQVNNVDQSFLCKTEINFGIIFGIACAGNSTFIWYGGTNANRCTSTAAFNMITGEVEATPEFLTERLHRCASVTGKFMYAVDNESCHIYRYNLTNNRWHVFANNIRWEWLENPIGLAADSQTVAILCQTKVHLFNTDTSLRLTYGKLSGPSDVCIDAKGNILIIISQNTQIVVLSPYGRLLGAIDAQLLNTNFQRITADSSGWLYVTEKSSPHLNVFTYE